MRSRVKYSKFSLILTIITIGILAAACICTYGTDVFPIILVVCVVPLAAALFYAPVSVSVDEKEVSVHSLLKSHTIPMRRITSAELYMPTMGALRIFGSGGFMGYWGIFKEGDVGRYMAYYGKSSDCFLVRLDNGDKYVLGCQDPTAIVEYINNKANL